MSVRALSAVLLLAATANARKWSPLTLKQELCWFSLAVDGSVSLPNATCCWGQVEDAGFSCPGQAVSSFNYSTSSFDYPADCDIYDPAAFIVASSASDIRRAINFCRARGIPFRVKSGGHQSNCESKCGGDCVVLSTSGMKNVEYVNASNGDVYMGVEPGIMIKELYNNYIANSDVLFPHGSCSNPAMGGHLLGGGAGYFTRKLGVGTDFIVGAEIVLASGDFIKVFDEGISTIIQGYESPANARHQDLLWALRGSGQGNFGVVTKFWMKTVRRPEYIVLGQAVMAANSVEAIENFWESVCTFYQSPLNETQAGRNLVAWPVLNGGQAPPFTAINMTFMFFYIPDNNSTMLGALAEARPAIAKFLEGVSGNYTLSLYPVTPNQMYNGMFSAPPKPLTFCTSRYIEHRADICDFPSWKEYFAERMYADRLDYLSGPTTYYAYFDPFQAAISENDPTFARSSFAPRNSWGTFSYCRVPLSETEPSRDTLHEMLNEVNATLMANVSSKTYSNAKMLSNSFRPMVYPYPFLYEKLQAVKLRYDPTNMFSSVVTVELPDTHKHETFPPFSKWW